MGVLYFDKPFLEMLAKVMHTLVRVLGFDNLAWQVVTRHFSEDLGQEGQSEQRAKGEEGQERQERKEGTKGEEEAAKGAEAQADARRNLIGFPGFSVQWASTDRARNSKRSCVCVFGYGVFFCREQLTRPDLIRYHVSTRLDWLGLLLKPEKVFALFPDYDLVIPDIV